METTRNNIQNKIRKILEIRLGDSVQSIGEYELLLDIGYELDSIAIIEILVDLEAEFGFDFNDEELTIDTIKNLYSLTEIVIKHIS